ncbi:MAG: hypothetical protein KDB44_16205 [Mycobacterium sp.]|nr:hypothetical protein [Mycobacterium sp.]
MKTHVRVAATTVAGLGVVLGLTTGCQRTTEGSVAQTTQPGPPLTSSPSPSRMPGIPGLPDITLPNIPMPNIPLPTRSTDIPEVPAPANALTMRCDEFSDLDQATRLAVVREILSQENNPLGPDGEFVGQILADAACQFLPSARVSDVLMGG